MPSQRPVPEKDWNREEGLFPAALCDGMVCDNYRNRTAILRFEVFFRIFGKASYGFMCEKNRLIAGGDDFRGIGMNGESTEETIKPPSWRQWEYGSDCQLL